MRQRASSSILAAAAAVCLSAVAAPSLAAGVILGHVASDDVRVDGLSVPSGTTLISPSLLATGERPAIVHLTNGQILALGQETRAAFEADAGEGVSIVVEQGTLAVRPAGGAIMTLASNSLLVLDEEGQLGEGTRVERVVVVCHLVNYTKEKATACLADPSGDGCEWKPLEVPETQLAQRREMGDVVAGDNDIGLDGSCQPADGGALVPPAGGGLGTAAKLGIGAAAVLGTAIALDEDDREEPASPIVPQ